MRVVPREEIKRRWAEWRARRVERERHSPARLRGLGLTVRLEDGRTVAFRGRRYSVPPVPWRDALAVLEMQESFVAMQANKTPQVRDWLTLYAGVGRLFKGVARPTEWWRRLFWPITPSPIRGATPAEVGEALGFFCACLTMDHVESRLGGLQTGTSQSTSGDLPGTSRRGARTGTLAHGSIS